MQQASILMADPVSTVLQSQGPSSCAASIHTYGWSSIYGAAKPRTLWLCSKHPYLWLIQYLRCCKAKDLAAVQQASILMADPVSMVLQSRGPSGYAASIHTYGWSSIYGAAKPRTLWLCSKHPYLWLIQYLWCCKAEDLAAVQQASILMADPVSMVLQSQGPSSCAASIHTYGWSSIYGAAKPRTLWLCSKHPYLWLIQYLWCCKAEDLVAMQQASILMADPVSMVLQSRGPCGYAASIHTYGWSSIYGAAKPRT